MGLSQSALLDPCRTAFAGAFVKARDEPRPREKMPRGGIPAHVITDLRDDDLSGGGPNSRNRGRVDVPEHRG